MRLLTKITDDGAARRFADYLYARGIETSVERGEGGTSLWVLHDDHLDAARRELAEFEANPQAEVYREAKSLASDKRSLEQHLSQQARKNFVRMGERWHGPLYRRAPVTTALIAASVAVAFYTSLGGDFAAASYFTTVDYTQAEFRQPGLVQDIWLRQPWRLFSSMFLHFGLLHIAFNMLMLKRVGEIVEMVKGSGVYTVLVLVFALASDQAQFFWRFGPSGGMSGVLYGLFGYVWMKSRFEPASGLYISREDVIYLMGWLVLCMTGALGPIANAAHVGGLVAGLVIGRFEAYRRTGR